MNKTPAIRFTATREEGHAQRAAGLLAQAKDEARRHVAGALSSMGDIARMADDIATGGEVYPHGVRDEMRRMAEHLSCVADRVAQIMDRQS